MPRTDVIHNMVVSKFPGPVFLAILASLQVVLVRSAGGAASPGCNRICGGGDGTRQFGDVHYPFGFSPGCPIQLNCSSSGNVSVGGFPVMKMTGEAVIVLISTQCDRPGSLVERLYGSNFAPTSNNAVLLNNCSHSSVSCPLTSAKVMTHFDSSCGDGAKGNVSCYSEQGRNSNASFIDLIQVNKLKCQYFLSGILAESAESLGIQMIELGWWLDGDCKCDKDANCTKVDAPNKRRGFRCHCNDGYVGDGFADGIGCRKESSSCNPSKYLSGQCGGTTRVIVLIAGLVAGASFMISLGLICCVVRRRYRTRKLHSRKRRLTEVSGQCTVPIYAYKEIDKATDHFSEKHRLGNGAYGTVYAGKLHGEGWVAVKRIRNRDAESADQVMNEIRLLSSVSHPNLVRLLGCSIEQGEQILVYEFMPNGTLCEHLQRERGNGLAWSVRLKIAAETARAIAHLHSAEPPIYHRDVKSSNILLDYDYKSKVADFGLSRLGMPGDSHISTAPQGTPGYLDPQYHQNFQLSDKSDVYSFGVVLVEIITSLKVVDFARNQNEVNLAALATDRIARGLVDEIIDPFLEPHRDDWTAASIRKVAELAFRCLAFHRDARPSMVEVAAELEQIRLSRWSPPSEGITGHCGTFSEASSSYPSSCSSSTSEKPLTGITNTAEKQRSHKVTAKSRRSESINSAESMAVTENSPESVQDSRLSEERSPSSNSLLSNVIR